MGHEGSRGNYLPPPKRKKERKRTIQTQIRENSRKKIGGSLGRFLSLFRFIFAVKIFLHTVCIKIKVIHFQRPIVLTSINLNLHVTFICKDQLILFPLVPFLHHVRHAHLTGYIAIEDDNVSFHVLQVLRIGLKASLQYNAIVSLPAEIVTSHAS